MPGVTKHIFDHAIRDIISMWNRELQTIKPLLPQVYTEADIINLLRQYYPHEWASVESKYIYYSTKDKFLMKHLHKTRYNMPQPEVLLKSVSAFKKLLSIKYQEFHYRNYSEVIHDKFQKELWSLRFPKIDRINKKIELAISKTQQVTPAFLDRLIGLYERKNTTQKDRVYILAELKKYYCEKIIQFFFKLNDTELNRQLREEAFYHLQSFNFSPRLRKQQFMRTNTKNKKRKRFLKNVYSKERYDIPFNPDELEYRIENSLEQKLKSFDYFISHSSKDGKIVQDLIIAENQQGKNVFCDWINDVDYLKRHLICDATLKVIEYRLQQSNALIFVESENSINSIWCQYELNYFYELKRPIYLISKNSIKDKKYELKLIEDYWFLNPNYKNIISIESR